MFDLDVLINPKTLGYAERRVFVIQIFVFTQMIPKLLEGIFVNHKTFDVALAQFIFQFGFGSFVKILGWLAIFAHQFRGKADANLIADRSIHQADILLHASLLALAWLFI
jgi:hypothetical protein